MSDSLYTFDFTKMTVGDVVFLSSIDGATHRDPANVKRLFQLLGSVTVGIDRIPAAELGAVMQAMTAALIDHIKVSAVYGDFVETLRFDEPGEASPKAGTKYCRYCGCNSRYATPGTICGNCGHDHSDDERVGWNKCEACGQRWGGVVTTCPACQHEHFNGAEQDND